jgi:hypothetical protein
MTLLGQAPSDATIGDDVIRSSNNDLWRTISTGRTIIPGGTTTGYYWAGVQFATSGAPVGASSLDMLAIGGGHGRHAQVHHHRQSEVDAVNAKDPQYRVRTTVLVGGTALGGARIRGVLSGVKWAASLGATLELSKGNNLAAESPDLGSGAQEPNEAGASPVDTGNDGVTASWTPATDGSNDGLFGVFVRVNVAAFGANVNALVITELQLRHT